MPTRPRQAAHPLATTDRPVARVAQACRFCDQSHFTRMFRKRTGQTPRALRAAHTAAPGTAPK